MPSLDDSQRGEYGFPRQSELSCRSGPAALARMRPHSPWRAASVSGPRTTYDA